MYYTDARHPHLYQLEPPLTFEQLCIPVDELLGTMVDTIVVCVGTGTTYLHDTKVGDLWGTLEEEMGGRVWEHLVWYRTSESVRQSIKDGYDPLRVLAERAHEKDLGFVASLRMNPPVDSAHRVGVGRLDHFRRDHPEFQIGEFPEGSAPPYVAKSLDFTHKEVRDERLGIIREVSENYPIDGLELEMESCPFFKPDEAEEKQDIMTGFVRDVRRIMDKVDGSPLLTIRTLPNIESCGKQGLDVATWINEGLLNIVTPMNTYGVAGLIDVNLPIEEWVEAAKGTGCQVYGCISPLVGDDRRRAATVEMYRAAALNYWKSGVDGIYLADFFSRGWPFTPEDYTILREVGDPDVIKHKDKHYWIPTTSSPGDEPYTSYQRQLPVTLKEGCEEKVRLKITDDLEGSSKVNILRLVKLRFRIVNNSIHDELTFALNGLRLPEENCSKMDFTYRIHRMFCYVFEFDLTHGPLPTKGWNEVTVKLDKRDGKIALEIHPVLNDVELVVKYRIARNYPTPEEERSL